MIGTPRHSAAQEDACDLSRHVAVTAGAGSGKTAVLVERYLRALEAVAGSSHPLGRVVAVTFTERAAFEMRSRVRDEIRQRLRDASRHRDRERVDYWRRIRDELHAARITTIHGLCAALLRQFPLEAGVDPTLEVMDAAETRLLVEEAARSHLAQVARRSPASDPAASALERLLACYRPRELRDFLRLLLEERDLAERWRSEADRSVRERVRERIETLRRGVAEGAARLRSSTPDGDRVTIRRAAARSIDDALATASRAALPILEERTLTIEELAAARRDLLRADGTARSFSRDGRHAFWGRGIERVREALGRLSSALGAETDWFVLPDGPAETLAAEVERDLAVLHDGALARFLALATWGRRTDFAGLELLARNLLRVPHVRARVQAEIDFLLVDEFQDTNRLQWSILHAIVEESTGPRGTAESGDELPPGEPALVPVPDRDAVNLFVVGDPKQAIYEFRGGRVEIFGLVLEWIRQRGGKIVSLDRNFRSLPAPIELVNVLFERVFQPDPARPFEPPPQRLSVHRAGELGRVELLLTAADGTEADEARHIASHLSSILGEGLRIADPETNIVRTAQWSDIAIIVFYRRFLASLESALLAHGIPFHVHGGRGFFQSPEVTDVLALLTALTDPRNDIALAALLRSPFFGFSDPLLWRLSRADGRNFVEKFERAAAEPHLLADTAHGDVDREETPLVPRASADLRVWRTETGRVPTGGLLGRIIDRTGYRAIASALPGGERRIANLEKLLDLVRVYEERRGIRPSHLVEWLRSRWELETDEGEASVVAPSGGVQLMTIHQAKGTEHPIVVIPDLLGAPRAGEGPMIAFHGVDDAVLGFKVPTSQPGPGRAELGQTTGYRLVRSWLEERSRAEQKRILYVAATRARDHLVLSTRRPRREAGRSPLRWLMQLDELPQALAGGHGDDRGALSVRAGDAVIEIRALPPETAIRAAPPLHLSALADDLLRAIPEELSLSPAPGSAGDGESPESAGGIPIMALPVTMAVTDLVEIARSPREFYRHRLLGLTAEEPSLAARFSGATAPGPGGQEAVELGRDVHRALARLRRGSDPLDPPLSPVVQRHVEAFVRSRRGAEALADPGGATEVPFILVTPSARIEGTMDRLYRAADGTWTVVDVKTQALAAGHDPEAVAIERGFDVQLALYALATFHLCCANRVRTVVFFTGAADHEKCEFVKEYTIDDFPPLDEIDGVLREIAGAMQHPRETFFPGKEVRSSPGLGDLIGWRSRP